MAGLIRNQLRKKFFRNGPKDLGDIPIERAASTFSTASASNVTSMVKDEQIAAEKPDHIWLSAQLEQYIKRGVMKSAQFLPRRVTVTSSSIYWSRSGESAILSRVIFADVAGIVYNGMTEEEKIRLFRDRDLFQREYRCAQEHKLEPTYFTICTSYCGFFRGESLLFKAESIEQRDVWVETIGKIFNIQKRYPWRQMNRFGVIRLGTKNIYSADRSQIFVASLIAGNFILNIVEAQLRAEDGSDIARVLTMINVVFTSVFTAELAVNIFSNFWWEFVKDAWNWFDSIVVIVSVVSLIANNLPGVSVLRLLRAFRVFRLFKRIPILVALNMSIPKMANAFVLVCLGTSLYSIVAVTFFKDLRPELYGDFFTAMFTMFQVLTGDAWGDIARDLFVSTGNGGLVAIFFVSYHLIVVLVLVNVVIAVLLDEFSRAARGDKEATESVNTECKNRPPPERTCPLERLTKDFAAYDSLDYLDQVIGGFWCRISAIATKEDCKRDEGDDSIVLDFFQFSEGLKEIGYIPPILFREKHWNRLVVQPGLCNDQSKLSLTGFRSLIRTALWRYQLNELSMATEICNKEWDPRNIRAVFLSLKGILLLEYEDAQEAEAKAQDPSLDPAAAGPDSFDELLQFLNDLGSIRARFENFEKDLIDFREQPRRDGNNLPVNMTPNAVIPLKPNANGQGSAGNFDFMKIPSLSGLPRFDGLEGIFGASMLTSFGQTPAAGGAAPNKTNLLLAGAAKSSASAESNTVDSTSNALQNMMNGKDTNLSALADEPIRAIMTALGQRPAVAGGGVLEGIGKGFLDGFEGMRKGLDSNDLFGMGPGADPSAGRAKPPPREAPPPVAIG